MTPAMLIDVGWDEGVSHGGARQDVQYHNCTAVEALGDEPEAPPPPYDWDQFRCPSDASSVTTESDFDAGTVELPSDDESA